MDYSDLDGDEVLQGNIFLHQELFSFGDKAHGSQQDLLVFCQVLFVLGVSDHNGDLLLWKGKQRWELGSAGPSSTVPGKGKRTPTP